MIRTASRRIAATSLLALATLAAASCVESPSVGETFPGAPKYVALGGSFAAGPGIPSTLSSACGRSASNYPHLVAARLRVNLVDASCQGATLGNITAVQGSIPAQITAVTADTALVTITAGGNDLGYSSTILDCELATAAGAACSLPSEATTIASAAQMRTRFVSKIAAIRAIAPNARILVVSYLRILPSSDAYCPPSNPIDAGSSAVLARIGEIIDETLHNVAADAGVTLVDAYSESAHTVCADPADRWVEGAVLTSPAIKYHPNAKGMAAVADLVVAAAS